MSLCHFCSDERKFLQRWSNYYKAERAAHLAEEVQFLRTLTGPTPRALTTVGRHDALLVGHADLTLAKQQ